MISKRIKQLIKKVLLSLTLVFVISTSLCSINTYAGKNISPYQLNNNSIVYQQKETKGRILIYNSHEIEEYSDGYTVVDASYNLKSKLEKLGYDVTVLEGDFSKYDYNNAYFNSRKALEKLDLDDYNIVIDLHRNAIEGEDTTTIDGKEFVKIMPVLDQSSPNYKEAKELSVGIMNEVKYYGDITKNDYEFEYTYNAHFNQDLGKNILLEVGNQNNSKWEVQRTLTYLANSIDKFLGGE